MTVRPSMKFDLEQIQNIEGGNLIYSLWEGYLQKEYTANFINYLQSKTLIKSGKIHEIKRI